MGEEMTNVFELNHWTLYRHPTGVSLKHTCQDRMGNRKMIIPAVFVYPSDSQSCWRCEESIPEGIVALEAMYNWDTL